MKVNLPVKIADAAQALLAELPKRSQTILERRFGLKGGHPATLDAIGKSYGITRERVRQIEADAFSKVRKSAAYQRLASVFETLGNHIKDQGGVVAEHALLDAVASDGDRPHAYFLLTIGHIFGRAGETETLQHRWFLNKDALGHIEDALKTTAIQLARENRVGGKNDVRAILATHIGGEVPLDHLDSYLAISKLISSNNFNQWGHVSSPLVKPRGMRDMAYLVLARAAKPLHFSEITRLIGDWVTGRPAHAQTVHNELIKDKRFVLVGRGMYGLVEWGYEPGIVRDVILRALQEKPLSKEEVVQHVLSHRQVKENTVLINLQNKRYFRKLPDGRYTALV